DRDRHVLQRFGAAARGDDDLARIGSGGRGGGRGLVGLGRGGGSRLFGGRRDVLRQRRRRHQGKRGAGQKRSARDEMSPRHAISPQLRWEYATQRQPPLARRSNES